MSKEKEHLIFGGLIAVLALLFIVYYEKSSSSQAQSSAVPSNVEQFGGTPLYSSDLGTSQPIAQVAQSAVPGVALNIGGSPTYLTYNIPNPPGTKLVGAGGISPSGNCSGNCGGCGDSCSNVLQPNTFDNFVSSSDVAAAAIDNYNNLQSTGLVQ